MKVTEHGEGMQPVISVDSINLTEAGMLELSGWMISKNINIMSSTDLPIVAYIDGNPVATAQRWRRDDITPIYGGGKYQYPWAGFKISIDLSQLSNGEHSYELRLTQPGYLQASVYLPNVSIAENTKYKIVFSGTKMTKATQLANQGIVINSIDELYIHGEKLNVRGTAKLGANGSTSGTKQVVVLAANGHEYIQTVTDNLSVKYANEGFDLQQLPAGYYQLAVKLQNQLDLAVSKNTINLEMFTVRRNGKFKKINITAKANQPISIVVAELNANDSRYANVADVILDPGHGGSYGSSLGDSGACSQWISCESTEMLDLSKRIEARLEQHGLNVELTRTATYSNGELPQYGPNSRTNKVYESKAKISISNHYNSSTSSAPSGFMVIHSKNNNNILADKITRNLNSMTGAKGDSAMGTVCDRKLVTGYHTLYGYDISGNLANRDCYFMIREYGGKVTQGVNHDYSSREVSPEPLLAEYFFGSNYSDVTNYRNKKTQYIEAVVKAIVEYYGIPYIGTYTIIQESDIIESSIEQQTKQDEFNNMKY
ncbi:MAG: N-acetylmuramoyl-L-alanine amidase [Culicoidibacterales bacterium]